MLFYRLLILIFSPIILGHITWKAVSNKQSRYFWQRLGFNYSDLPENCTWFHCASVGEVNTLLPLLKNLHTKNDRLNFIITTNTITGGKIIRQQKQDYLIHCYLPFDWTFSVNRFISKTNPATLYVMETEIWPNLFTSCHNRGVAIHIINARLSS
ncbi:MAG: 3-deoxy-D-manno-octulosonic acid transferase, partial [Proteobacteria bacterium]|nr:3-deoxy-D-manno-octulosonic acid transferase [Pseudomonadota bacterium]